MDGVARTVVGYSGGIEENPTYRNIKDSTECILLEYDPDVVTFEDVLAEWSRMHSPYYPNPKTQYRSIVFYGDESQKKIAMDTVSAMKSSARRDNVYTSIEPITTFYRAEEYHQNYLSKKRGFRAFS